MKVRRHFLLPVLLAAGNLALFVLSSWCVLSGAADVSHHWLFAFHEFLLLVQALVIRRTWAVKALTGLSCLVLLMTAARIETIYQSHHLIHAALAWGLAAPVHFLLSRPVDAPWREFNYRLARSAPLIALVAAVIAARYGIWWGMSE